MFDPITLPFGAKMLFNTVKLKPGVTFEEVELAVGDMCNVVKETCGGDKGGFIAGQVFKFFGFVSDEGSLSESRTADEHYVIVTYWRSFEEHEKSHADAVFSTKFEALAKMCTDTKELGYDMLWQGAPVKGSGCDHAAPFHCCDRHRAKRKAANQRPQSRGFTLTTFPSLVSGGCAPVEAHLGGVGFGRN